MSTDQIIGIHHSPDADDAFMFFGLVKGGITVPGYRFNCETGDIESLNRRALNAELGVTAVSVHAYAYLNDRYAILTCGASMGGEHYGPRVVALRECRLDDGVKRRIGIPGEYTSATLALKLFLRSRRIDAELVSIHFDKMQQAIQQGEIEAGVIIHEGQVTHQREGFVMLQDLGEWWWSETGLPLPLGINIVRRDLGEAAVRAAGTAVKQSILCALDHREEALEFALSYGRGISRDEADQFVSMYVNDTTVEMGAAGRTSIQRFLERGVEEKIIARLPDVQFIDLSTVTSYDAPRLSRN